MESDFQIFLIPQLRSIGSSQVLGLLHNATLNMGFRHTTNTIQCSGAELVFWPSLYIEKRSDVQSCFDIKYSGYHDNHCTIVNDHIDKCRL